jgi:hypothetical protein
VSANGSGAVSFSGVPKITGHLRLISPVWITPNIQLSYWTSPDFEFGTNQIFQIQAPFENITTIKATYPDGQPLIGAKATWPNGDGISDGNGNIYAGTYAFEYKGPLGNPLDQMNAVMYRKTDLAGEVSVARLGEYGMRIGISSCSKNGRATSLSTCRTNLSSSSGIGVLFNEICYHARNSILIRKAVFCSESTYKIGGTVLGVEPESIPPLYTSVKYDDGNLTEARSVSGSNTVIFESIKQASSFISLYEVASKSPVSISVATNQASGRRPFYAEVIGPNNKQVRTCKNDLSVTKFSSTKPALVKICPTISGDYIVKTSGIGGTVKAYIKVTKSAPMRPESIEISGVQSQKTVNFRVSPPRYDGGVPVSKLKYTVSCGTKTLSGSKTISFEEEAKDVSIARVPGIGRCKLSLTISNKYGTSPSAGLYYIQH